MIARALLDSNVVIAAAVEAHQHHHASAGMINAYSGGALAVPAHGYAESYNTLTRGGGRGLYEATPAQAWAALERIRAVTTLVGLTPAQTLGAVRSYADQGGVGPRLYDKLIGETAVLNAIPTIVTWNVRQMRALFPDLAIVTPEGFPDGR